MTTGSVERMSTRKRWGVLGVLGASAALTLGALGVPALAAPTGRQVAQDATPGAAPVAGQFCKGMNITFFPGGTPGGGFETVVYNGAKAAEAAFGPTVSYQWSDWDPSHDDQPVPARPWPPSRTASRSWVTPVTTRSIR